MTLNKLPFPGLGLLNATAARLLQQLNAPVCISQTLAGTVTRSMPLPANHSFLTFSIPSGITTFLSVCRFQSSYPPTRVYLPSVVTRLLTKVLGERVKPSSTRAVLRFVQPSNAVSCTSFSVLGSVISLILLFRKQFSSMRSTPFDISTL